MRSALEAGSVIGSYRIVEVIGRGGMGVVYRAEQSSLERQVALKVMSEAISDDERFRERFVRECRLAASIDHPHILPIYEAGDQDGALFLAMRFIPEGDLGQLLRHGPLEPERALALTEQIASALDAAHARGLVHRDVKPANVLVAQGEGRWHAYLTDFGISARHGSHSGVTGTGGWVGTVDYVAPEQILDACVDGRADVYSLGCLLYEALTGDVPFPRENEIAKLWAHMRDDPPSPSASGRAPARLDSVVARAMAKEPEQRYPSAEELAAAAWAALRGGRGVNAPAAPRHRPRLALPHPSRPALLTAGSVAVVAALALAHSLVGGGHSAHRTAPQRPVGVIDGAPIPVGDQPVAVTVGGGKVWVANTGDNSVSVIDPHTDSVIGPPIKVGREPQAIAAAGGSVWVANHADRTVTRIDERTQRVVGRPVRVPGGPYQLAVAGNQVWVAGEAPGTVSAINARSGRLSGRPLRLGSGLGGGVAADRSTVWMGLFIHGSVQRIAARTQRLLGPPLPVGGEPEDVLLTGRFVWLALGEDHVLARLDRRTGARVGAPIPAGDSPVALAGGGRAVWSVDHHQGRLYGFDARTGRSLGRPLTLGIQPEDLAVGSGSVWVADQAGNTVTRVLPASVGGKR